MMNRSDSTALVLLRSEEAKSLIGLAVSRLPQVQQALGQGRIVIVGGSTTRHVVRHLLGEDPGRDSFAVGWIKEGLLGESPPSGRGKGPFLLENGQWQRGWPGEVLQRFTVGDLYIKGANAIDPEGHAAILMASPQGGTIGVAWPLLQARGCELIVPVSLAKLIPSVAKAAPLLGQGRVQRVMGSPVGLMTIPAGCATLISEIQAFQMLFGLTATLVAAGGLDDCEGALCFHLAGTAENCDKAWNFLEKERANSLDPCQNGR
ncbi:MAG: hypothetical protein HQL56_10490 [Magnetococcales bacterium]|nr:hypothetical protein [Magnetococcales bacterium]